MSSEYRKNHYVPVWYQKRFLPEGRRDNELFYLDLRPPTATDSKGRVHQRRAVRRLGFKHCFAERDLYTTRFGTDESTRIEQMFFGSIDSKGRDAVEYWTTFAHPSVNGGSFNNVMMYMSTQKLRTPKGLGWLSSRAGTADRNAVLQHMVTLRQLHCAIWTRVHLGDRGLREVRDEVHRLRPSGHGLQQALRPALAVVPRLRRPRHKSPRHAHDLPADAGEGADPHEPVVSPEPVSVGGRRAAEPASVAHGDVQLHGDPDAAPPDRAGGRSRCTTLHRRYIVPVVPLTGLGGARQRNKMGMVEAVGIEPTSGNPQPQASTPIAGLLYCSLVPRPSSQQEDLGTSLINLAPPLRPGSEPATRI
jgi:hypothetical protein